MVALCLLVSLAGAAETDWDVEEAWGPTHEVELDLDEVTWASVTVHGDRLVFDLLGDLWTLPVAGGEALRLTEGAAWDSDPRFSPDGEWIAYTSDRSGNEQLWVMRADGKEARRVTDEEVARVTDPIWDPAGPYLIGRRRTVDTRSIGVTELWQWHLEGGAGIPLTDFDEHPHAGEPAAASERYLYYSTRRGRFEYGHDPMSGLWRVERLDRRTGESLTTVHGAGGAVRPTLSPDGRQLAVVTRNRLETWLEIVDLNTGSRRVVADWLDHDQMEGFALHGVYPAMSWTEDHGLVLWAGGALWRLDPETGEREEIPFRARGSWRLHDVPRWTLEVPDELRSRVLRWPTWSSRGELAFSAVGKLWRRSADGELEEVSDPEGTGYAPAWSPDGRELAWTSWDDESGGALHITRGRRTRTLPIGGQLVNPAWGASGDELVVLRGVGGGTSPDLGAEARFEIVRLSREGRGWSQEVLRSTGNRGSSRRAPRVFLHDDRVWWFEDAPAGSREPPDTALVSVDRRGTDRQVHLIFDGAQELVPSPDFQHVAYKQGHSLYVVALPRWARGVEVASGALPTATLTERVGDWVSWTPDGSRISWTEGPVLHRVETAGLLAAARATSEEEEEEPPSLTADAEKIPIELVLPRARPEGWVALTNARVLTMQGDEVLEGATVLVEGDRIVGVGSGLDIPAEARVIDCTGKTILPGLIDVHAHLHYTAGDIYPEQEWRYLTALDFGVTTVHDPSASTDLVFTQAERVEAGLMRGPRVYSTGFILYGALNNGGAETPSLEAARDHVRRLAELGAPSVKIYQQSQRERRQWYAMACAEQRILCVPEGGGDLWMDLGMLLDGYHAIEHSLPNAPIYEDVRSLFAATGGEGAGTAYTPTLLVAYGGLGAEHYFFQKERPLEDDRLLRHYPERELAALAWRRPLHASQQRWNFQQTARDAAALARQGVLVTLGAHGELQGLGVHWELWALAGPGAMSPHEALQAATLGGATYLGLQEELGTVEPGKLADLIVLDSDPREDIRRSTDIAYVLKNGELM